MVVFLEEVLHLCYSVVTEDHDFDGCAAQDEPCHSQLHPCLAGSQRSGRHFTRDHTYWSKGGDLNERTSKRCSKSGAWCQQFSGYQALSTVRGE